MATLVRSWICDSQSRGLPRTAAIPAVDMADTVDIVAHRATEAAVATVAAIRALPAAVDTPMAVVGITRAAEAMQVVVATAAEVAVAKFDDVASNVDEMKVAVNEVKNRGEKGVPNGTPFLYGTGLKLQGLIDFEFGNAVG